ncbi:MAG: ribose 5-phosphate isomerase B [Candidatus Berkelbacteria bacterium Licking1014_85]|uniref:Ribose 5-phosphate isomerase B n=1 Tax=Candidatus Berkelbacteria bacterium Licking1014_85 TaxID=2017148 RepID=A0A554LMR9_9BACT|nr:MAG: ribose 5-phosphate isomerase B [Candidatus Berkelbacteria bacterium Licking1014_85]
MKIYLGADHNGLSLKHKISDFLSEKKIAFEDSGAHFLDSNDDYPDISQIVAEKVAENESNRGILICKSGQGVCIASNKIKGIRAAQAFSAEMCRSGRHDDDINILCLSSYYQKWDEIKDIIDAFLETEFSGEERFGRRIGKL